MGNCTFYFQKYMSPCTKKAPILMILQRTVTLPSVNIIKKKSVGSLSSRLSETAHVTLSCSLNSMQKSNVGV